MQDFFQLSLKDINVYGFLRKQSLDEIKGDLYQKYILLVRPSNIPNSCCSRERQHQWNPPLNCPTEVKRGNSSCASILPQQVCTICRKLGAVTVVEIINVTSTEFHLPGLIGGIKLGFIEATLLFILIFPFPIPVLHLHTFTYLYPLNLWRSKDAFTYKINLHTINFQHVIWPEQKADLNFELIVISHLNDLEVPSISADVPMFLQTWGVKQTSIKE